MPASVSQQNVLEAQLCSSTSPVSGLSHVPSRVCSPCSSPCIRRRARGLLYSRVVVSTRNRRFHVCSGMRSSWLLRPGVGLLGLLASHTQELQHRPHKRFLSVWATLVGLPFFGHAYILAGGNEPVSGQRAPRHTLCRFRPDRNYRWSRVRQQQDFTAVLHTQPAGDTGQLPVDSSCACSGLVFTSFSQFT